MNKTIRMNIYTAVYCALGTAAFCAATTVALADEQTPPTETVKYADLDISQSAGAQVLYHRIQAAAREVCPLTSNTIDMVTAEHACINKAIDDAVKSVNAVALTQLRFGTPVRLASK
jgi:UrcA family protein